MGKASRVSWFTYSAACLHQFPVTVNKGIISSVHTHNKSPTPSVSKPVLYEGWLRVTDHLLKQWPYICIHISETWNRTETDKKIVGLLRLDQQLFYHSTPLSLESSCSFVICDCAFGKMLYMGRSVAFSILNLTGCLVILLCHQMLVCLVLHV